MCRSLGIDIADMSNANEVCDQLHTCCYTHYALLMIYARFVELRLQCDSKGFRG